MAQRKNKGLGSKLRNLRNVGAREEREPRFRGTFKTGPAGVTGETYHTIAVLQGQKMSIVTDPRTGDHPVFKDRKIAEKIVSDLEKMRTTTDTFPDVTRFVVTKLEVGKPSKIVRPDTGIVLPSSIDISKYGGRV